MKHTINNQFVLSRTPDGPLAVFLDGFASFASAQGYASSSIHRRLLLAACFSQWLKQEGIEISDITSDHPARYLRYRAGLVRVYQHDHFALGHFIEFLRLEGVIPPEKVAVFHVAEAERLAQAYEQYLRETCGLAAATIMTTCRLSGVSFSTGSVQDRWRSHSCLPAISPASFNARRGGCTGSERSS